MTARDEDGNKIAEAIRYAAWTLGTANAATPMGAIEVLSATQKEALESLGDSISTGLSDVAEALREVASAINRHAGSGDAESGNIELGTE
jgi:hypothetical protein